MKKYIACPVTDLSSNYANYVLQSDLFVSKLYNLIALIEQDCDYDTKHLKWVARISFELISYGQNHKKFIKEWNIENAKFYEKLNNKNNIKNIYLPEGCLASTLAHVLRCEANIIVKLIKQLETVNKNDLIQWYSIVSLLLLNIAYELNKNENIKWKKIA